jgi:hypothetical protein
MAATYLPAAVVRGAKDLSALQPSVPPEAATGYLSS